MKFCCCNTELESGEDCYNNSGMVHMLSDNWPSAFYCNNFKDVGVANCFWIICPFIIIFFLLARY